MTEPGEAEVAVAAHLHIGTGEALKIKWLVQLKVDKIRLTNRGGGAPPASKPSGKRFVNPAEERLAAVHGRAKNRFQFLVEFLHRRRCPRQNQLANRHVNPTRAEQLADLRQAFLHVW